MKFEPSLTQGTLIKRYKRFLADVTLADGSIVTAHCANTGSMKSCGEPGDQVWLSHNKDPKRKLAYSWELTQTPDGYIGINTARPNQLVEEALKENKLPGFSGYDVKREAKYGSSRLDFLLTKSRHPDCWIEVKNVTLFDRGVCYFPDAVTTRGLKHLACLAEIQKTGDRAVLLFVVNRAEGSQVHPAGHIDAEYAAALTACREQGVEVVAFRVSSSPKHMHLAEQIPVHT